MIRRTLVAIVIAVTLLGSSGAVTVVDAKHHQVTAQGGCFGQGGRGITKWC